MDKNLPVPVPEWISKDWIVAYRVGGIFQVIISSSLFLGLVVWCIYRCMAHIKHECSYYIKKKKKKHTPTKQPKLIDVDEIQRPCPELSKICNIPIDHYYAESCPVSPTTPLHQLVRSHSLDLPRQEPKTSNRLKYYRVDKSHESPAILSNRTSFERRPSLELQPSTYSRRPHEGDIRSPMIDIQDHEGMLFKHQVPPTQSNQNLKVPSTTSKGLASPIRIDTIHDKTPPLSPKEPLSQQKINSPHGNTPKNQGEN